MQILEGGHNVNLAAIGNRLVSLGVRNNDSPLETESFQRNDQSFNLANAIL